MVGSWTAVLLLLIGAASAQNSSNIPLSTTFLTPITVPLGAGMRSNSTTLLLNDPTVAGAQYAGTATPTEVHLTPAGQNAMYVMWATGNYTVGQGTLTALNPNSTSSVVKYGTSASNLNLVANGIVEVYNQIYNTTATYAPAQGGASALNYTSPYLHSATLSNLTAGTKYFYQVGDGTTFSGVYNFTALLAPGPTYPQRIIAMADWGASQNSTVTLAHALLSANASGVGVAPVLQYIGDFCYADTWYGNGTVSLPTAGAEGLNSGTYQPVWDLWQRMIEPLVSYIPTLTCTGNHEIEQQDDANSSVFVSVQHRWKVPSQQSLSPQYFFYSQEYGPVHSIMLSVYTDYSPGSPQWNWLAQDLLSVNRTKTPWVTVAFHNPVYSTDTSYKEFDSMRIAMQELWQQAGVDVFFYGHVHSYERTTPIYNFNSDPCGSVHITIGDAGNTEGLSFLASNKVDLQFEDLNGGCPNVTAGSRPSYLYSTNPAVNDPFTYYQRSYVFQADGNSTGIGNPPGYCYNEQPMWSSYREPSFGHGTMDVLNGTHALWSWHRNQDNEAVTADQVYIVRNTTLCPNKMYPMVRATNGAQMPASA